MEVIFEEPSIQSPAPFILLTLTESSVMFEEPSSLIPIPSSFADTFEIVVDCWTSRR
jgi:hypothetical protein